MGILSSGKVGFLSILKTRCRKNDEARPDNKKATLISIMTKINADLGLFRDFIHSPIYLYDLGHYEGFREAFPGIP